MSGKTTTTGQTAAETSTSDTPAKSGSAQVEVSDSGVDTSRLTASQKAIRDFEPVELTKGDKKATARTQAQLVSLKFDGYVTKD
jgi:hypothetical protein